MLPVSRPPIADGFVRISGNRVVEVGDWVGLVDRQGVKDLGEVILLPGLINAHCHLEYSNFVGTILTLNPFSIILIMSIDSISSKKVGFMFKYCFKKSLLNGIIQICFFIYSCFKCSVRHGVRRTSRHIYWRLLKKRGPAVAHPLLNNCHGILRIIK